MPVTVPAPPPHSRCWGRLHAAATARNRTASVIEIGALRALALAAAGGQNAAVDALAQALIRACPQGYIRVFADEGPPISDLLGRLVAAQRAAPAAARRVLLGRPARVLRALGGNDAAPGAAVPGLIEPLTAHELEVLALLAAGAPNPRIAAAGSHRRHGQKARQPPAGQARRGQPHRGRHPRPPARP